MTLPAETLETAKSEFDRDGFSIIRGFLSNDEIEQIESQLQDYIGNTLPLLPPGAAFYETKGDSASLFRLAGFEEHSSFFAKFGEQQRFMQLGRALLNDRILFQGVQLFGKAPKVGGETPAHQDNYYFTLAPSDALTMWLAIDRSDSANGCVRFVPGSHKRGLLPHGRGETFGFSMGLLDFSDEDRAKEISANLSPGDLVVHHCLTIHRADPNLSNHRRWGLGMVYFANRAKPDQVTREARKRETHSTWKDAGRL